MEKSSQGVKINCVVVYSGFQRPQLDWFNSRNATIQAASSSYVNHAAHREVSSEIFVSATEQSSVPSFCQMSMPVYRCNELSYVYTHKFSIHLRPLNGKCRTAILNVLLQLTALCDTIGHAGTIYSGAGSGMAGMAAAIPI